MSPGKCGGIPRDVGFAAGARIFWVGGGGFSRPAPCEIPLPQGWKI